VFSGVAHRKDRDQVIRPPPPGVISISAYEVHRAERCPRWRAPFETLLS
jgi:hypothetical protein